MKVSMKGLTIRCVHCGRSVSSPEFPLKASFGTYIIKCKECTTTMMWLKVEGQHSINVYNAQHNMIKDTRVINRIIVFYD